MCTIIIMYANLLGCIHSLDWTTGLRYFPFLDKCLCLFLERSLHVATPFYNQQVPGYCG